MSKKSVVLLTSLGLAAAAVGAYVVRLRDASIAEFEADAEERAVDNDTPFSTDWSSNEAAPADEIAAVRQQPVGVR